VFTNDEMIERLEISIANAKSANMLQKHKLIEHCVDELLCVVKLLNQTNKLQTQALFEIKQDIDKFKKRGFSNG
jgi:hypothetical protein